MALFIVRDNILHMKVDAIVNSTWTGLLGGGRTDAAIHKAAGPKLDAACRKIGYCAPGKAVITKGYNLPCKYIIHTVGPVWEGGESQEEETLKSCYKESLLLAAKHRCRSVAIPLISGGYYGYPKEAALKCADQMIRAFLADHEMDVYLVVFNREAYRISRTLFDEVRAYVDDHYVAEVEEGYASFSGFSDRRDHAASMETGKLYSRPRREQHPQAPSYAKPQVNGASASKPAPFSYRNIELDESFSEMLLRLIDEKHITDSECYKKANIDRKLFSKIRSNKHYSPSKNTAVAFAISLELDYDETQELLRKAGLTLSHSNMFDVIVEYFIKNRKYDIYEINEVLFEFDQKLLGAVK